MSAPRRSAAIAAGLWIALGLGGICLAAALWDPIAGIPLAAIFLASAYGIHKRHRWSAYGGALLLAAMGASAAGNAMRAPMKDVPAVGLAAAIVIVGAGIFALYRVGIRMPAGSTPGARSMWIALAAVVFLFPQSCRAYVIGSGSMEDTVLQGDRVLVVPLAKAPVRGEIVQHRYPVDFRVSFLKRVVATGGDRVRLHDKQLIVNGVPVNEPYARHRTTLMDEFRDNFPAAPNVKLPGHWAEDLRENTVNGELVVPAGKFFVLGDNRDESLDSRYFGFLERSDFQGRPVMIYFSADVPSERATSPVLLHPSMIRWERVFKGL